MEGHNFRQQQYALDLADKRRSAPRAPQSHVTFALQNKSSRSRMGHNSPRRGVKDEDTDYRLPAIHSSSNAPAAAAAAAAAAVKPINNHAVEKSQSRSAASLFSEGSSLKKISGKNRIMLPGSKLDCQCTVDQNTGRMTYVSNFNRKVQHLG